MPIEQAQFGIEFQKKSAIIVALNTSNEAILSKKISEDQLSRMLIEQEAYLVALLATPENLVVSQRLRDQGFSVRLIPGQYLHAFLPQHEAKNAEARATALAKVAHWFHSRELKQDN